MPEPIDTTNETDDCLQCAGCLATEAEGAMDVCCGVHLCYCCQEEIWGHQADDANEMWMEEDR